MLLELADITFANMNQIRKDSFCRKIGVDVYVFSFEIQSGLRWGSGMRPDTLDVMVSRPNMSECMFPLEINATLGRSMGWEH